MFQYLTVSRRRWDDFRTPVEEKVGGFSKKNRSQILGLGFYTFERKVCIYTYCYIRHT